MGAPRPRPPDTCPLCGGDTESHVGVIDKPAITCWGVKCRSKHLGRFTVCMRCEWAVEDSEYDPVSDNGPAV